MGQADRIRGPLNPTRAERQARSVEVALRGRGLPDPVRTTVLELLALAMARRGGLDDHHPAYLHPGRSALVLLHDVSDLPPEALSVAVVHDSQDEALRLPIDEVAARAPTAVTEAVRTLPLPGEERLAERLVLLDRTACLAALAERLDHLRHLHMRPELQPRWVDDHREVGEVWLPVAQRADERLARRYAHWVRTFAKRLRRL